MQHFLDSYIKYHAQHLNNKKTILVLPSKRAVSSLKHRFVGLGRNLWLPEVLDIVSLIEKISKHDILDQNQSLLLFFKSFCDLRHNSEKETYESFCTWASSLLADFNELDRFLVDIPSFFKYHKELKELSYFGQSKTDLIKKYIKFWEDLPDFYNNLKLELEKHSMAYQGLAYRKAYQNIESYIKTNSKTHVFIGFNALNKAEEGIIETLLYNHQAKVIWDIDPHYIHEQMHPSKVFIEGYQNIWDAYKDSLIHLNNHSFAQTKSINYLSSTKQVGIVKNLASILKQIPENEIGDTAVVLNDEELLGPVLNSIPCHIEKVNITMGLSLKNTPISSFFDLIISHQKSQNDSIYSNDLLKLVSNPILGIHQTLESSIKAANKLFFSTQEIREFEFKNPLQQLLIDCLQIDQSPDDFINKLELLLNALLESTSQDLIPYISAYHNICIRLGDILKKYSSLGIKDVCYLFSTYESDEKLSFKGAQTEGLQIMGMLETRLLDYKNVIMLSVNEGIIPSGKSDNSYITYAQKQHYGLPTHKDKDAVYAYHFFRLIQRCKNCYLLFDTDQSGMNKGEMSRFAKYLQIFKMPNHTHLDTHFSLSTTITKKPKVTIQKTDEIIEQLNKLSRSGISPTALTTYIQNPISFYKRYILNIRDAEQIESEMSHKDYGTIVHGTLEDIYAKYKTLKIEYFSEISQKVEECLQNNFHRIYSKKSYLFGANRLRYEIALASIHKFLDKEMKRLEQAPVTLIALEKEVYASLELSSFEVILKGTIDRIDNTKANVTRIVDYKTGNVLQGELSIKNWDDLIHDYKYSKAFQTLFYALIYSKTEQYHELQAGIISLKNLKEWFMPVKEQKQVNINPPMLLKFETYLKELIEEIFNPHIPFVEKETTFK